MRFFYISPLQGFRFKDVIIKSGLQPGLVYFAFSELIIGIKVFRMIEI